MSPSAALRASCLLALCTILPTVVAADDLPAQAEWQSHRVQFSYVGITSRYSCRSLQTKLRLILEFLGARPDADVQASGCPGGDENISRSIMLVATFSTLSQRAQGSESLAASWSAISLAARKPSLLDDGDCELIEQSRRLILENFTWRTPPRYLTDCPLNGTAPGDFVVQGETLRPAGRRDTGAIP